MVDTDSAGARTRRALLAAAGDLLEGAGPDAVTLRALGAAAGLSRGAAYRHFTGKDDLLAAVAAEGLSDLAAAMSRPGQGGTDAGSPARELERALIAYFDAAIARPARYSLIFGRSPQGERPELKAEGAAAYALLLAAVEAAQRGAPSDAGTREVAGLLWSAVHGMVDLTLSAPGSADKGLADPHALIGLLVRCLLPEHP